MNDTAVSECLSNNKKYLHILSSLYDYDDMLVLIRKYSAF